MNIENKNIKNHVRYINKMKTIVARYLHVKKNRGGKNINRKAFCHSLTQRIIKATKEISKADYKMYSKNPWCAVVK